MRWHVSHRYDPPANALAKQHYTCQSPDSDQYIAPGTYVALVIPGSAVWVTLKQKPEYVDHAWPGAWLNSIFRNQRGPNDEPPEHLSSELIWEAIAATRFYWDPPEMGLITFINERKVKRKRDLGRCYRKVGFREVGRTKKKGHLVLQLLPEQMPPAEMPFGAQLELTA